MGFELLFQAFVVLIFFGFIALMVKWRNDLKREKIRAEDGGSSLGTSELRGLIQEAVHDANAPLEERLGLIEAHMRQLPDHDAESKQVEAPLSDEPTEN